MPTLFPEILFLAFFAPVFLRIGIAILFLDETRAFWKKYPGKRWLAVLPAVLGVSVAVGFLTQLAVLVGIVYAVIVHNVAKQTSVFGSRTMLLLAILIFLSLFITGPGGIAFDLPY